MAIVKTKPVVKKTAVVAKKAAPAAKPVVKSAPKTAAAGNDKLKGSVKKTFDPAGLGNYQDVWAGTEPAERGEFGDIPDGKYQARIDEAILDTGKDGDRLQVKWTLSIVGPEFANRKVWQNSGLMDEKGIQMTKGNLKVLGIEIPEEITELPDTLDQVKNLVVDIALVTKEGKGANAGKFYQNTYINKLVTEDGATAPAGEKAAAETEASDDLTGKHVTFTHEKVEYDGTVVRIMEDGENAEVEVDGEKDHWELPLSMLTEAEAPAAVDTNDFVGQYVEFTSDGQAFAGDVTGVDKEGNLVVVVNGEEWGVGVEDVMIAEKPKPAAVKIPAKPAVRSIVRKS